MRNTLGFLILPVLLQACATQGRAQNDSRDTGPPAEKMAAVASASDAVAAKKSEAAIQKTCRSPLPVCFDAALKICRDRDFQVRRQERTGDQSATLWAQGRACEFTLAFARTPTNQTRLVLQVQGRALQENRDEASSLLNQLCDALLEPRD
jgi:hypothetical protein